MKNVLNIRVKSAQNVQIGISLHLANVKGFRIHAHIMSILENVINVIQAFISLIMANV